MEGLRIINLFQCQYGRPSSHLSVPMLACETFDSLIFSNDRMEDLLITTVFGTGTIKVTLFEYWNPTALKYDGACCDGAIPGCPLDQCDHHFDICLSDNT
ncbi:hypothetical protein CHS0354_029010, partial [Potamilus streckersoni]